MRKVILIDHEEPSYYVGINEVGIKFIYNVGFRMRKFTDQLTGEKFIIKFSENTKLAFNERFNIFGSRDPQFYAISKYPSGPIWDNARVPGKKLMQETKEKFPEFFI